MAWRSRIVGHDSVDPEQLTGNPRNHRTHPQEQRVVVRDSIAEFGFVKSVLVNKTTGFIVDGHERVWQALEAKQTDPTVMIDVEYVELSEGEEAAVLAILDASTDMAIVDPVKLDELLREVNTESQAIADMLTELAEESGALDLVGDATEVEDIEPEISRADELAKEWGTEEGQLWIIEGKQTHRLLCGDSTKSEDVERLMDGDKADLLTDPPYGIGIAANPVRQKHAKSDWDNKPVEPAKFIGDGKAIIWGGNYFDLPPAKGFLVWDKKQPENFTLAMCEQAWTNVDTPAKMFRQSVTSYQKEHPTQKPVELLAWCLGYIDGQVFDPFLGSGTTMLAAEQLNRKCYGMELSPKYCAVILQRMKDAGCTCTLSK